MTKYLNICIITNNQTALDDLLSEIPARIDPRVWDGEYFEPTIGTAESGDKMLTTAIHFKEDAGREEVFEAIQNSQEIFNECLPGTMIQLIESYSHDDPKDERSCEPTAIFEVTP